MKRYVLFFFVFLVLDTGYCVEPKRDYFRQAEFIKSLGSNFITTIVGKVKYAEMNYPIYKISFNPKGKKKYLIICGVHGNEPAPVYAIEEYLQDLNKKEVSDKAPSVDFIYIVNPWGFSYNQRCNADGVDINRDISKKLTQESRVLVNAVSIKQYDRVFDFHEENTKGYYLYYYSKIQKKVVDSIIELYEKHNLPLESDYKDVVLKTKDGVIFVPWYAKKYMENKDTITTALWAYDEGVDSSFTIETSKNRDIEERKKVIKSILDYIMTMDY